MLKYRLIPALLFALLAACGQQSDKSAAPSAAPATPAAPAPKAETAPAPAGGSEMVVKGEDVFKKTCALCHKTGEAGAPKLDNKDEWGPRIAQGKDVLYEHALKGYTGKTGAMPAKGGNTSLSDDDVKTAVDYIVAQVK